MVPGSEFVWTDVLVEILLNRVLAYKDNKTQDNVDCEQCQSKYVYIVALHTTNYNAQDSKSVFAHVHTQKKNRAF